MTRNNSLFAALLLAATVVVVPAASAQTVHFVGAGSSALYQVTAIAASNDIIDAEVSANPGWSGWHYTAKGTCGGVNCAGLHDARTKNGQTIPDESGSLWVVWDEDDSVNPPAIKNIYTDISVDSVVGDRCFFATQPNKATGCTYALAASTFCTGGNGSSKPCASPASNPGQNLIADGPTGLFTDNNVDADGLPAGVYNALNGTNVTVGLTDIRPEDALFAYNRAAGTLTSTLSGLGYGPKPISTNPIKSFFSTVVATPVQFALSGNDPISGLKVRGSTTIPVGADPILFLVNRTDASGLGQGVSSSSPVYTNVVDAYIKSVTSTGSRTYVFPLAGKTVAAGNGLFSGELCDGASPAFTQPGTGNSVAGTYATGWPASACDPNDKKAHTCVAPTPACTGAGCTFAVNPILREPLSGTMNTTEFTTFRIYGGPKNIDTTPEAAGSASSNSQEANIVPTNGAPDNPLGKACVAGGGSRYRAIGTGEEVKSGVYGISDAIGYAFFSFGNVSKIAGTSSFGYLQLDGVDGLYSSYNGGDPGQTGVPGQLPTCNAPCPASNYWTGGTSYPNLRNGTYRAWSILRAVADPNDPHYPDVQTLIADAQNDVDKTVPDFVPYTTSNGSDPGLQVYREHFAVTGVNSDGQANNGLGGTAEVGGDVGGLIVANLNAPGNTCEDVSANNGTGTDEAGEANQDCLTHAQQ
ncbi:MAG: hypothetical protein JOY93_04820 [Acidobacteriales bacterium]|nr:hypothetical protein [Terriglobales bacterium]